MGKDSIIFFVAWSSTLQEDCRSSWPPPQPTKKKPIPVPQKGCGDARTTKLDKVDMGAPVPASCQVPEDGSLAGMHVSKKPTAPLVLSIRLIRPGSHAVDYELGFHHRYCGALTSKSTGRTSLRWSLGVLWGPHSLRAAETLKDPCKSDWKTWKWDKLDSRQETSGRRFRGDGASKNMSSRIVLLILPKGERERERVFCPDRSRLRNLVRCLRGLIFFLSSIGAGQSGRPQSSFDPPELFSSSILMLDSRRRSVMTSCQIVPDRI